MPSQVVTLTSTRYLQVPKVLPHRKSRSRSKPRGPEVVEYRPSKVQPMSPILSPTAMADLHEKCLSHGCHAYGTSCLSHKASNKSIPHSDQKQRHDSLFDESFFDQVPSLALPDRDIDLNGDLYSWRSSPSPPPPQPTLRERLVGTWYLESYVAYPTPTCKIQRPTYPMTKSVTGLIMYTPDGYMSAHMMIPGQAPFKRGEGEEAQWAEAGKRSFCYAGPYYISNEGSNRDEVLRHTFQVCNLPGWLGDVQVRTWSFEEDDQLLVLGSEAPTEIKGDQRIPILKWRRARPNAHGTPPAPTPQIKVSGPGEP